MKLIRLLRYDFRNGFIKTIKHILVWIALCAFFCLFFSLKTKTIEPVDISLLDYFLFLFSGEYPYDFTINGAFQIPYIWMLINMFVLFTLCSYPIDDTRGFGQKILIKSSSRPLWLVSKYIWSQCMSSLMYCLLLIAVCMIGFLFGMNGVLITASSAGIEDLASFSKLTPILQIIQVFFLPLLVLQFLLSLQLFVGLLLNPIFSFVVSVSILFVSAYINNSLFVGNLSMFRRVAIDAVSIHNLLLQITVLIGGNLFFLLLGSLRFHNQDLLSKPITGESDND